MTINGNIGHDIDETVSQNYHTSTRGKVDFSTVWAGADCEFQLKDSVPSSRSDAVNSFSGPLLHCIALLSLQA